MKNEYRPVQRSDGKWTLVDQNNQPEQPFREYEDEADAREAADILNQLDPPCS